MPTEKKQKPHWLNPEVLAWARNWRGRSMEEAAAKVGKEPRHIKEWESGESVPTVRQARILAEFYERPFLEFVLPRKPEVPEPSSIPDFRMQQGEEPPPKTRDVQLVQQWAETQRTNALDLFSEIGEHPPRIPNGLFFTPQTNVEHAADQARSALKFSIQDQISMHARQADALPTILRSKFEQFGILTLRRSDLKEYGVRGICLALFPLPVIVFRSEAPSAQAFTLAHELAHILIRQSGIIGPRSTRYRTDPIERWADQFAAAFLIPAPVVHSLLPPQEAPSLQISDEQLSALATVFRVSPHAMLIRLVHLGYVQANYYWQIKKPQFDADEREYKSFGRSKYYGSRFKARFGELYTGLVLEAWSLGRITNHNAAEYLGIKNINHLHDIREHHVPT